MWDGVAGSTETNFGNETGIQSMTVSTKIGGGVESGAQISKAWERRNTGEAPLIKISCKWGVNQVKWLLRYRRYTSWGREREKKKKKGFA